MEHQDLKPEQIEIMNVVAKGLISMPDKMAVATIAMALTFLHQKNDNRGLTSNILGLVNGIACTLCEEHRILFLTEIKTALETKVIPMAEDNIKNKTTEKVIEPEK